MIAPHLQDDDFLQDVSTAPTCDDCFHVWWLGQSGFLIKWGDADGARHLLLDPYLSDSLTRKYADTEKPHIRMTARVVDPARLDFVDVATSSHNHTDHLDAETLGPILDASPSLGLVIPEANRDFVAGRLGIDRDKPHGLAAGGSVDAGGFRFRAIPAAHDDLDTDDGGRHLYLGYVVQFGDWTVYHSGDTVGYKGLDRWLEPFKIYVAFLPINGRAPQRRVAGNLWGRESARLAKAAGVRLVVPCHYDMFSFNTATPDEFVHTCHDIAQPYRALRCGERWSSYEIARS